MLDFVGDVLRQQKSSKLCVRRGVGHRHDRLPCLELRGNPDELLQVRIAERCRMALPSLGLKNYDLLFLVIHNEAVNSHVAHAVDFGVDRFDLVKTVDNPEEPDE